MNNYFPFLQDTIVAIATPQGVGAIGIIRLSGENSFSIAQQLIPFIKLESKAPNSFFFTKLEYDAQAIDDAVVLKYQKPHSFTGEDMIELSCHGSPFILKKIVEVCLQCGARMSKPGEFTYRAFIHGKMDLSQAESVADLIHSQSAASQQTALNHLRGGLKNVIQEFKDKIIEIVAFLELELDFSQEDVEFVQRDRILALLHQVTQYCQRLLDSFVLGNAIKNGVQVALIGEPNVGKSSLLNTILDEDRVIVSDIAGTTRDSIEETFQIKDIVFRFIDTAGLRESQDLIEQEGIKKSYLQIEKADIILLMMDSSNLFNSKWMEDYQRFVNQKKKVLLVANKMDLITEEQLALLETQLRTHQVDFITISTKNKIHIEELKANLYGTVVEGKIHHENVLLTNVRHKECFEKILGSLRETIQGIENKIPTDLLVVHLKESLYYLGEIAGQTHHEDILDVIFSRFCIGK